MSRPPDSSPNWQSKTQVITAPRAPARSETGGDCLVVIYSKDKNNLGKRFVLEPTDTSLSIGRGADNGIVLESENVSRRHARFDSRDGTWWVTDLKSTNGTYVNDESVTERGLNRADYVKIGDTIFKYLAGSDVEAAYHEEIYRLTIVDGLTQAHNKRYLFEQIDREMSRARRYQRPLTLVMFDIDHFKRINDTYLHLAGDYVLREMAGIVRARIRRDEVFARYGGEEFSVLLPETDLAQGVKLAENLCGLVGTHRFAFDGAVMPVTISLGVAQLDEAAKTVEEFVDAADRKLYEAKRGGRNRVES